MRTSVLNPAHTEQKSSDSLYLRSETSVVAIPPTQGESPLSALLDGLEHSDTSQASVAQQYIEPGTATSEQDPRVPTFLLLTIMTARVLSIISCTGNSTS